MGASVIVLLGPPGAGKGTQAARLARSLGVPHVATGDLFRENLANDTELGGKARSYMDSGALVPDDLVVDMLFDRVARDDCSGGYLLDGFPRNVAQAECLVQRLDNSWSLAVVVLNVPDEQIIERAAGRLLCRSCTNIHHVTSAQPKVEGICDACGGELYRREDDRPEVVRDRLGVFYKETRPVVEFYETRGGVCRVDGSRSRDQVFDAIVECIGANA